MNLKSVFLTPKVFFGKPTFMVVAGVYTGTLIDCVLVAAIVFNLFSYIRTTGTYIAANFIMSWCEFSERNPEFYKLGGTTVVNMTLGILKDKYFAQKFSGKPVERFPLTSWSMFVMRDLFTIGAGFNLPRLMSSHLVEKNYVSTKKTGDFIAQFAAPMSAQFIITPMHLLSLDFYNNKISNASARFRSVASNYLDSTGLRMGRVICAYGLAGVFNNGLKQTLRDKYVGQPKL